jgi:hypothetical protein
LPQVTATVTDDANFKEPTELSGVPLEELRTALGIPARSDLIVAICGDQYHAHFPADYIAAHQPILVLKINGKGPDEWPKDVHRPRRVPGAIPDHACEVQTEFQDSLHMRMSADSVGSRSTGISPERKGV